VLDPTKPHRLIKLTTLVINFCFNLVLIYVCSLENNQGDQIGRNFAIWVIFYGIGQIFILKKSPNDLGKILASHEKIAQN
jgi:hypothetical protein